MTNTYSSYRIIAFIPGSRDQMQDRISATPYSHAVWVQSIVKGHEGEWIFCGFASNEKRASALARKEGGTIVQTEIQAI